MEQVEPGCVEFLDLSGIEDRERNWILSSLHSWNPNIQLPWMEDINQQQSSQGYESPHIANVKLQQQKRTSNNCSAPSNLMVTTNINVNDPPLYTQIPPYTIPPAQPITMYAQHQHNIPTFPPQPPNIVYTQPNPVPNIQTTFVMNSNATYSNIYMNTKVEITQEFTNQQPQQQQQHIISNNGVKNETSIQENHIVVNHTPLPPQEEVQSEDDEGFQHNGEANGESESPDNTNVASQQLLTPPAKSWASLFNKPKSSGESMQNVTDQNNTPNKPLALVPPFVSNLSDEKPASPNVNLLLKEPFKSNADDPNLHRMGEFLSAHVVDNRITSLQPRGLINRSNYCYINSILQAILACPPVYNLISGLAANTSASTEKKRITPTIDSMTRFVKEFNHLPAGMRVGRRIDKNQKKDQNGVSQYINTLINCDTPFEPFWINKLLSGVRSDTFVVEGRQEDAEEFLGCLLNGLNDEMLELIKLVGGHQVTNEITQERNTNPVQDEDKEWQVMGPKNKGSITRRTEFTRTPISDIFGGLLRSRLHRAGDQSTDNIQPFFTLQLNIEKTNTVKEALEVLACKNQLEGVTSSKTNEEVEAWQQVTLEELPIVLVLHLKCFDYKLDGCSKIIKALEFPIDLKIDMKLLSSKTNYTAKERQYKLFAVVYHEGKEATKGHYVTDAYHVGYASWLRYDDASVKTVPEEHVLKPHGTRVPYLLFYRRSDALSKSK